jgi:hypothetical protein
MTGFRPTWQDQDDYEVVWNGGPLLPEYDSLRDPRWVTMPSYSIDDEHPCDPIRDKRPYHKVNADYWFEKYGIRVKPYREHVTQRSEDHDDK